MIQKDKRKKPLQTVLSMIIMGMLVVIGVSVFLAQFHYNPAVLQKDALAPDLAGTGNAKPLTSSGLFTPLPEGVTPLTPAETFHAKTLSDKINGKAELYLQAGFKGLVSQRFKEGKASHRWMEAFVYDMGSGENAFSVFSTQRRKDAVSLDLSENAYRSANALFLTHGPYYVEIIASEPSKDLPPSLKALAEALIRNTPLEKEPKKEDVRTLFPKAGLVENSISLIASNAFGYDGFDRIYTAEYHRDGARFLAFLSRRESPREAKEAAAAYGAFLQSFGGRRIDKEIPIKHSEILEILDTYEIVFSRGPFLAGIREAASLHGAETLAVSLYDRLKE